MECRDKVCIEPKEMLSITDHKIEGMTERLGRIRDQLCQLTTFFWGKPENTELDKDAYNDLQHAFDEINNCIPYDIPLQQKLEAIDRWLEGIRVILSFCNDAK